MPFYLAFSTKTHCIQHQNTLHLAPKHTAFSTKTQCIQHQNAVRFGAKCTVFCSKWPSKRRERRLFQINIHFIAFTSYPLFTSKQTFARVEFLRPGERLVDRKGTQNVKNLTKYQTKTITPYTRAWATTRKAHTFTNAKARS